MAKLNTIRFPEKCDDPAKLADWLELAAVHAADQNASAGDLERELDRLNIGGRESLIGSCFSEIDKRVKSAGGEAYPFVRNATSIELKTPISNYPSYIFCLSLSFFGWKVRKGAKINPWLLFEELCFYSAKNYLGGNALIFGTSSRTGKFAKNKFKNSIDELAKNLGEGENFRPQRTFSTKDSRVDIVAWKGYPDHRASQIVLFAQCAAGLNWSGSKLTELNPDSFWDQWMSQGPVSSLLPSVFIPHRVFDDQEWELHARRARLLFDRCRIVQSGHHDTSSGPIAKRLLRCCKDEWSIPI